MTARILYLFDQVDWKSRIPVAEKAKADGYEVTIALIGAEQSGEAPDGFNTLFIQAPSGQMKGRDLLAIVKRIRRAIVAVNVDLVHTVTLKYAFITGLSALPFQDMQKVYTLAGLGYLFRSPDAKARLIRAVIGPLLRHVLRGPNAHLIFQNPDDLALMVELGYATTASSILIRGSGVDLSRFAPKPELASDEPLVLMPTRLVHEKGIHIFVEAARLLKAAGVQARFQIAGGETKHNPKAISKAEMEALTEDGAAQWLGWVEDIPALLSQAAFIVYPSYYGEGIPRVLLETCAAGRPIITTDHAGCREAVDQDGNGLLVAVRDVKATAEAIKSLLGNADKRAAMGLKSRAKAEAEFDINIVADKTLTVYKTALKN